MKHHPSSPKQLQESEEDAASQAGCEVGLLSVHSLKRIQVITCVLAAALLAYYVYASFLWPVVWDGAVMHYIHFLITRGLRPYSDITDMNLPGSYLVEGWAMDIFGWGDISWRMYEYFLMLVLGASGIVIGGRRHWTAGIYCVLFFALEHGAEGPMMAVERDEVMMVLLVAATAFFFVAMRRQESWLLLPFGVLAALAASIKPGAILLDMCLTLLAFLTVRRRGNAAISFFLWSLMGNLVVLTIIVSFLFKHQAFPGLPLHFS